MKRNEQLESFQDDLIKLIASRAPSVDIEDLMSNKLIVIGSKGGGVRVLIGFKAVRALGLDRLRRIRCTGSCRHVLKMIEEAFSVLAIKN